MSVSGETPNKESASWIEVSYDPQRGIKVKCSLCNFEINFSIPNRSVCPECGAQMEGSHELPRNYRFAR